jgi:hypothetical protein
MPHFCASVTTCSQKVFLVRKRLPRHPIKIATIRLQWNRKPKMMPPAKVVLPFKPGEKLGPSGDFQQNRKRNY